MSTDQRDAKSRQIGGRPWWDTFPVRRGGPHHDPPTAAPRRGPGSARTSFRNGADTPPKQPPNTIASVVSTSRARQYKSILERLCGQPLLSDELIQSAVDMVARSMGTEAATLYAYDARADQLVLVSTHGLNRSSIGHVTLKPGQGMSGRAFSSGSPVVQSDVRDQTSPFPIPTFDRGRYRSLLAVPVPLNSAHIGVLNVQTIESRQYQPREIQDLAEIAELLGPVLGELWRGDLAARIRGPGALSLMNGLLSARYRRADVGERLAEQLNIVFPARRSTVGFLPQDGPLDLFGDAPDPQAEDVLRRSTAECADVGEAVVDESGGIFVPLRVGARVLGGFYLGLGEASPAPVSSAAMRLLDTLARQVANALLAPELERVDVETPAPVAAQQTLIQLVLDGGGLDLVLQRGSELCGGNDSRHRSPWHARRRNPPCQSRFGRSADG